MDSQGLNFPSFNEASCAFPDQRSPNEQGAATTPGLSISFWTPAPMDQEKVITQVLENVVADLDNLRADLERRGLFDQHDVRELRPSPIELLRGIPGGFNYDHLMELVLRMKMGLARRRVSLEGQA